MVAVGSVDHKLVHALESVVRWALRGLLILSALLVVWGVIDVAVLFAQTLVASPPARFGIPQLIAAAGALLAVLVAAEIFENVRIALTEQRIALPLVVITALTALARKLIVLEFEAVEWLDVMGVSAAILALAVTYAVSRHPPGDKR